MGASDILGFSAAPTTPGDPTEPTFPSYLGAADNHNLGNQHNSWFDTISNGVTNMPKFMLVSALSGLNSFYNTGVQIGNFFGADLSPVKTDALISDLDSDLGKYYKQNSDSADLMGFMATSLAPGIGAVKVLNAGQTALAAAKTGLVGTNLGLALGLRATQIDTYVTAAAGEIAKGQAIFSSLGTSGVKALSAGVYQNVLEGIAFETAVQATMQASPILEHQDKSDILWNVAYGGLFSGVIGGALSSASIYGKIRAELTGVQQEIQGHGERVMQQEMNKPAARIISNAYDLEHGPTLNPGDPLYAQKVAALQQKQIRTAQDMRKQVGELVVGDDPDLHRMVADINVGAHADDVLARTIDTDQIGRYHTRTTVEAEQAQAARDQKPADPNLQVHYWKLTGDDSGTVLSTPPVVLNAGDLATGREGVMDMVAKQRFKVGQLWDAAAQNLGDNGHLNSELRYIWARGIEKFPDAGVSIHMNDIPMLQAAARLRDLNVRLVNDSGQVVKDGFASLQELADHTQATQRDVARQLQEKALSGKPATAFEGGNNLKQGQDWINNKIGKITNTRLSALEGTEISDNPVINYDAMQAAQQDYERLQMTRGLSPVAKQEQDVRFLPTWAKVTKRAIDRRDVDGNVINGLTWYKTQENLFKQQMNRVVARNLGEFYGQLPPELSSTDLAKSTPMGTGAGLFSFSNPSYGGPGSIVSLIGSVAQRAKQKFIQAFSDANEGALGALGRNQEAAIEWDALHQKVSRSAQQWYAHDVGTIEDVGLRGLIAKDAVKFNGGQMALKKDYQGYTDQDLLDAGLFHKVNTDEAWKLTQQHVAATRARTLADNARAAAQGKELSRDPDVFRPIRPDPKDTPFFAFVSDPKVTGQGHKTMIFAENEQKLQALAQRAQAARPDLQIIYKSDTKDFYDAYGMYEYDRSLSENYLDSSMKSAGIYSDYFTTTDPQKIVNKYLDFHTKAIGVGVQEDIRANYQAAFDWWEDQAHAWSRTSTSKFGGNIDALEQSGKNPYLSYIKTALNLSRASENKLWYSANKTLDDAVSKAVGKVQDLWDTVKGNSLSDEKLTEINRLLQKQGLNTGYYDAATTLLVNHTAPANELSKFIRGANAVLSRLTLGLDPLNALNNAIGANILRGTELTQITDAIKSGDSDLAGKLAALGKVDVTGQGDLVLAPSKLIASSMKRYFSLLRGDDQSLLQFYKDNGFIRDISDQYRSVLDNLALKGDESVSVLNSRYQQAVAGMKVLVEKGEKLTGNKLAEEFNRFVSADVMKQLTDMAVERGLLSQKEALSYINTFVNRVEGNVIASQRPFVFQGPIGQAIGLFQSYQFNLMQQMFRYVSEGSRKDAAMLLGLQGTFYGIQGLPAFQAINQHIIGTASGNTKHIDAYDATYGIAGKNLGDLLTYGIPSTLLQTNLYSRGDINPRQITVIPTALNEVPVVGAFTKFFTSLKDTANRVAAGGAVWESLLQGIEHNGISRPLAGLAQTLQATAVGTPMSTSTKGDILFSNDLLSLATLSRLSGGRPLDEAIVNDGIFRIHTYQALDTAKQATLAEAVKSQAQVGNNPDWGTFADRYAQTGGRQINFNKFMVNQIKNASVSQSEKIINQLQNPFAQKVQVLMGGPVSPNSLE